LSIKWCRKKRGRKKNGERERKKRILAYNLPSPREKGGKKKISVTQWEEKGKGLRKKFNLLPGKKGGRKGG